MKKTKKKKFLIYPTKSPFEEKPKSKIKNINSSVKINVSESTITSLVVSLFKGNWIFNYLYQNPDKEVKVDDFHIKQSKKIIIRIFFIVFIIPFLFLFLSAFASNSIILEGKGVGFFEDYLFFSHMLIIVLCIILSYIYFEKFRRFFLKIQNIIDLDSYGVDNYKVYINKKSDFINGIGDFFVYKLIIYVLGIIGILWWIFPYKKFVYSSLKLPFDYQNEVWRVFTYSPLSSMVSMIFYFVILGFIIVPLIWRLLASSIVLNRFCKDFNKNIQLITLHPDGVGGLRPIADVALNFHFILLLPIITFMVNIYVWGVSQSTIIYGMYFIILVFVFFLPLTSAHDVMSGYKEKELYHLSKRHNDFVRQYKRIIENKNSKDNDIEIMERMDKIRSYYSQISSMPIWPFDATILRRFAGSILIPFIFLLLQVYVFY
jgi:hypothetical protein